MTGGIALVGPTASGKTALSLVLAELLGGEVISMDSRQVYRGMDVGTAKATREQRERVPHHGLDLLDPNRRFSAAAWAELARDAITEIAARGRVPLLVGGTGFYLRALTEPLFAEPPMDPARRDRLRAWLESQPESGLRGWLRELDPGAADRLERGGGRQRLLRALELPLLTGRTLSALQRDAAPEAEPLRPRVFVLSPPPERLRATIDARVTAMAGAGLLEEVRGLLRAGYVAADPGMSATGYAEMIPVLTEGAPLAPALDRVRASTRAYARRQRTWFRHQLPPDAEWLPANRSPQALAAHIAERWHDADPRTPQPARR